MVWRAAWSGGRELKLSSAGEEEVSVGGRGAMWMLRGRSTEQCYSGNLTELEIRVKAFDWIPAAAVHDLAAGMSKNPQTPSR